MADRISADRAGFNELDRLLHELGPIERAVMESSGNYWFGIASHLARAGVPVAVVSPVASKYFAKRRSQRAKSYPADARTLAALGMVDRPRTREPLAGQELREAARFAMTLVQEQARCCQRILRLVDIGFPELRMAYEDPGCASAIALLREGCGGTAYDDAGEGRDRRRPPDWGEQGRADPRCGARERRTTRTGGPGRFRDGAAHRPARLPRAADRAR